MLNNLILFTAGFISICVSAFIVSTQIGLLVLGLGLIAISLLFDIDNL